MEWATEEELNQARSIAEQGLRELALVSNFASNSRLGRTPSGAVEVRIINSILPTVEQLAETVCGSMIMFHKAVRTIERSCMGDSVRPFANNETKGKYLYSEVDPKNWTA